MFGKGLRLYKKEKLRSVKAIDRLFACRIPKGATVADDKGSLGVALAYPLRMVYGTDPGRPGADFRILVSVPKKRLRKAVDRVTMRRRIREAYRLARGPVELMPEGLQAVDVAFIYVADTLVDSDRIHRAMRRLFATLLQFAKSDEAPSS